MAKPLRTERFGLALSPPERDGLRALAELEGLAEADVLRRMLRQAINNLPSDYRQAINWPTPNFRPSNSDGNGHLSK
jgi:hypothetical protein